MADAIFFGLKLAVKAYKAYGEAKEELMEFADDYDELNMRLTAMQPILDGLANNLDDSLSMTLELAKSEQEKANKYTEELLQYTRKFKGNAPFFANIATALAAKAITTLPEPLQDVASAMLPIIKKHGVPEKAYAKFADKLHFLVSALAAAASTQLVKSQSMSRESSPASKPTTKVVEMSPNPGAYQMVSSDSSAMPSATMIDVESMSVSTRETKLKTILEENIEENDADFRAILLGSRSVPYTLVFGLWLERKPHILTVTFFGLAPASMRIIAAPSNDYIMQLQKNPQLVKSQLGKVRTECKAVSGALDIRKNHQVIQCGMIPYVGILCNMASVYGNCLFTTLALTDVPVASNKYTVLVDKKKILVNGTVVFEPQNLHFDMMGMCCSCCCPSTMFSEMCC